MRGARGCRSLLLRGGELRGELLDRGRIPRRGGVRGRLRLRRHPGGGHPRHEQLRVQPRKLRRRGHRRSLGKRGNRRGVRVGIQRRRERGCVVNAVERRGGRRRGGLGRRRRRRRRRGPLGTGANAPRGLAWSAPSAAAASAAADPISSPPMALSSPLMRGDLEGIPPGPMVGVPGVSPSESDAAASSRPSTPPELIRAALGRASRSAVPSLPPDPDPDPSCESSPDASPEPDPECIAPVGFARRRADLSFPMRRCAFELGSWMSVSRVLMALSSRVPSPSPSSSARMMLSSFFTCSREKGRARRYRVGSDGGSTRCVEEVTVDGEDGAGRRRGDARGRMLGRDGGGIGRGAARAPFGTATW